MLRICLVALLAFVAAANVILEFEEKIEIPAGWSKKSAFVDESKERTLYFAVKRQNMKTIDDMFWKVSDPRHADYGKYLTFDQLGDLIRPKQEHIDAVNTWLDSFGLNATWNQHFDYASVKVPVAKCKQMFGLEFSVFQHESGKRHVTSLGPYFVPSEVAGALDLVSGLVGFPLIKRAPPQLFPARPKPQPSPTTPTPGPSTPTPGPSTPTPGPSTPTPGPSTPTPTTTPTTTSSGPQIGPTNLRTRYNITDLGTNVNNRQAVAEFQQEYFAPKDLATFWTKYVNYASSETVYKTVGTNKPGNPGLEASLDVQYIASVAPGVETWFWSTPSMDFWTDLTAWAASIANTTDAPWVHSVSYGSQGQYPSATYQNRLDGDFQTFGTRGISIIFASGDSGCGCKACAKFQPSFPATSIYVTSVGATRFISGTEGPEEAVTEFGSGGGMSLTFTTPSYQQAAVSNYFSTSTNLPAKKFYNAQGRGTPDVSALGWGFDIVVSGQSQPVGGTSASTPTFAAIVSLLNDQQLNAGAPTLGFLNQWIYQTAANVKGAFWDVTEGNNKDGCCPGFQCAPGWDPVTGVGTPNYEVLKTALP